VELAESTLVLTLVAIAYALALILITLAILARFERPQAAAQAPPADPHAPAVAEFARDLADWDRRGRPWQTG
jgi:hypothetical protein